MSDNVVNATEQILRDIQTALAGMATKADIAEIKADIAEIKQTMATKADILGLTARINGDARRIGSRHSKRMRTASYPP